MRGKGSGSLLEAEAECGEDLAAVVVKDGGTEVLVVEGIEVAFLGLQLVGEVEVTALPTPTKSYGQAVDAFPVGVVGLGEWAVVGYHAESIVLEG